MSEANVNSGELLENALAIVAEEAAREGTPLVEYLERLLALARER